VKLDANFLLALIVAIATVIATIAGWFFFFFRGWFEQWLTKIIERQMEGDRSEFTKFKKTTIKAVNKVAAEQIELDKTLKIVAKDEWKTKQTVSQLMEWASLLSKENVRSFRASKKAVESFDDYWGEVKLDLDSFTDPFASQPERK
jgi:hypothetical protein